MEIRTFKNVEEIRSLEGFRFENPLNAANYERLLGDYRLGKEELRCCYQRASGNLCHTIHKFGYVALLKNASITIIGNECARQKFDAMHQLRRDAIRYQRTKELEEARARIRELLNCKGTYADQLSILDEELAAVTKDVQWWGAELGSVVVGYLKSMARARNGAIYVKAISYRPVNEHKEQEPQRRAETVRIGTIGGLELFVPELMVSIRKSINDLRTAYSYSVPEIENMRISELRNLGAQLSDVHRVSEEGKRLVSLKKQFLQSDIPLFCFLQQDKSERYAVARAGLRLQGFHLSRDKSKQWVISKEHEILMRFNAIKIEIN